VQIAYVGFIQRGTIRSYEFEGISERRPGQAAKHIRFSMTADMGIVNRHHVKIQDVPALCMRTLAAAIQTRDENDPAPGEFVLTEGDVHSYCSAIAIPVRADHRKRFRPKPNAQSQFQRVKKA